MKEVHAWFSTHVLAQAAPVSPASSEPGVSLHTLALNCCWKGFAPGASAAVLAARL